MKQEDYDTVFYPGGHGPMWDLAEDPNSVKLVEAFLGAGKPVALVCHVPGALCRPAVHLSEGERRMTGDSDYRFGAFELLVRRQLLVHAGTPMRIGSRALAILTALVEGAGDLVTKEKLIASAWPTTFVGESNLKVNVANLRRALRSNDPGQDYIATVPGRGYRFIAAVHRVSIGAGGLPPKIPLIGRADDLAAVQEWLSKNSVVTVAGTGGIGKTALAASAAHAVAPQYLDGVTFVDLAKISAALFIPAALAFALGVTMFGEDPLAGVIHALEGQRKLLLIDNCEHLMPAVASVIDRLSTSLQGVRILATSREPLRIRDEHVHRLDPLKSDPRPSPTASEASAYPAVELFVTRAFERTGYELHDDDAPNVAEICRRLDGIPLAIELAATRIGTLTPALLLELLGHSSHHPGLPRPCLLGVPRQDGARRRPLHARRRRHAGRRAEAHRTELHLS